MPEFEFTGIKLQTGNTEKQTGSINLMHCNFPGSAKLCAGRLIPLVIQGE
jgi:hypothetical protein